MASKVEWKQTISRWLSERLVPFIDGLAKLNPEACKDAIAQIKQALERAEQSMLNDLQKRDAEELQRQREEISAGRMVPPLKPGRQVNHE